MSDIVTLEKAKYEKAWELDAYRNYSPAEAILWPFLQVMKPKAGNSINDYGAGTGRAAMFLHDLGYEVNMIDIANNCLDEEVREKIGNKLVTGNLWDEINLPHANYGMCIDVMEHIPTEKVDDVIQRILDNCDICFFHICLREDHFGEHVGEHLHLTVKEYMWWKNKIEQYAKITDTRHLLENGLYVASKKVH